MSTLDDTDAFVVNRGFDEYQMPFSDMTNDGPLLDDDLFVVDRGGVNFSVTAKDVLEQSGGGVVTPPVMSEVTLVQTTGDRYDNAVFTNAISYINQGSMGNIVKMGAKVVGDLQQKGKTSPVSSIASTSLSTPQVSQGTADSVYSGNNATTINNGQIWSTTGSNCLWIDREELGDTILTLVWKSGGEFQIYATGTPDTSAGDSFIENVPVVKIAKNLEDCTPANWPTNDPRPWARYIKVYSGGPNTYEISLPPTLTFQTDQDLLNGAFQPGDMVHKPGEGTADLTLDPANSTPDAQYWGWNTFNGTGYGETGLWPTVIFNPPLTGKLEVICNGGGFFHVNKSDSYFTCPTDEWTTLNESGEVSQLDGDAGNGTWPTSQYVYMFRLDGEELIIGPGNAVISVDGAAKQMTLDGGTWDVGDVVENSVIHPIMVTPETSAITEIGVGANQPDYGSPEQMFDGIEDINNISSSNAVLLTSGSFTPIMNYQAGVVMHDKVEIWTQDSNTYTFNFNSAFEAPNVTGIAADWVEIDMSGITKPYTITDIEAKVGGSSYVAGIKVDGVQLISGAAGPTTITFTDNTDLADFTDGMSITQDAPVTPVTSAITGVSGGTYLGAQGYLWDIIDGNNPTLPTSIADIEANGVAIPLDSNANDAYGAQPSMLPSQNFIYVNRVGTGVLDTTSSAFQINGTGTFSFDPDGGFGGWYTAEGVRYGGAGNYGAGEWGSMVFEENATPTNGYKIDTAAAWTIFQNTQGASTPGGYTKYPTMDRTVLTFQDNQQLDNFQSGDVVTGGISPNTVWNIPYDSTPITGSGGTYTDVTNSSSITAIQSSGGGLCGTWTSDDMVSWNRVGSFNIPGELPYSLADIGAKTYIRIAGEVGDDAVITTNMTLAPGQAAVVSSDPDNNQMVVSGGTWEEWNQSRVWSNGTTTGEPYPGGYTWVEAFNGSKTVPGANAYNVGVSGDYGITISPSLSGVIKVIISSNTNNYDWGYNGQDALVANTSVELIGASLYLFTINDTTTLSSLSIGPDAQMTYVEVDGQALVDTGISGSSIGQTVNGTEIDGKGICVSADPTGPTMNIGASDYTGTETGTVAGPAYAWSSAFNGTDDLPGACGNLSNWNNYNIVFNTPITGTTIVIRGINQPEYSWGFNGAQATASNTTVSSPGSNDGSTVLQDYVLTGITELTGLSVSSNNQLVAVFVDGERLVSGTSPRFAIGSKVVGTPTPSSSITAYLDIDSSGLVSGLSSVDPGLTTQDNNISPPIIFPATMSSGQTPNEELPPGTTIQSTIRISNGEGSDEKNSNILDPTGSDSVYLTHCPTEADFIDCHQRQQFNFRTYEERTALKMYHDVGDRLATLYDHINDLEELYEQEGD